MLILAFLLLPAQLTADALSSPHAGSERVSRDIKVAAQPIKLVISEGCVQGDSASVDSASGKQLDLAPDSPLVLTHRIRLVPSSGLCGGCEADFEAFRQRLEGLEREVSTLRQTCAGAEGGCCTSQPSKGPGCTVHPQTCPDDCNDQGRCMDGKCVCFSGYTGEDCSISACPDNCSNKGKCVDGQCVCDPGFTGPVCSSKTCPDNCKNRGRCVNGQCVCNPGFTGPDCSTPACPDNCNNQGQCVNGKCVCDPGFTGPNCATAACPDNCSNRGRCVNGQCVCDPSFTGTDCSTSTCPDNCNNQGRCINGKCVCEPGFSGPDCSTAECPNNCNNWGRCVNGKCVCDVGFSGPDCSLKSCPNNCSNRGRCVRGKCVCRRGFTGPDCSECEEGLSGPDCDTALTGVTNLITKDITESTVTLSWTPPMVQYDTYYITFTSQKEGDQKITSTVGGQFSSYIQTGLAAGQEYHVSISGEKDGKRGAESIADFTTLISGPTNLQVVKTTTTSVIVQWERPQMEIERYHLKVSPTQGRHRGSQDMTLPPERDSAQIDGLEPGVVYDVTLVAEKDGSHSMPATVQVIPDSTKMMRTSETTITERATKSDSKDQETPRRQTLNKKKPGQVDEQIMSEANEDGRSGKNNIHWTGLNGNLTKPVVRPGIFRRPGTTGPVRFNSTQMGPGRRRVSQDPMKRPPIRYQVGELLSKPHMEDLEKKHPIPDDRSLEMTVAEASINTPYVSKQAGHPKGSAEHSAIDVTQPVDNRREHDINIAAHPNGKKCHPKLIVGHQHLNATLNHEVDGVSAYEEGGSSTEGLTSTEGVNQLINELQKHSMDLRNKSSTSDINLHISVFAVSPAGHLRKEDYSEAPLTVKTLTDKQNSEGQHHASLSLPRPRLHPFPPTSRGGVDGAVLLPYMRVKHLNETSGSSTTVTATVPKTKQTVVSELAGEMSYSGSVSTSKESLNTGISKNGKREDGGNEEEPQRFFQRTPTKGNFTRRLNIGPYLNRSRPILRPPLHPSRGPIRRPFPLRVVNSSSSQAISRGPFSKPGKIDMSRSDSKEERIDKTLAYLVPGPDMLPPDTYTRVYDVPHATAASITGMGSEDKNPEINKGKGKMHPGPLKKPGIRTRNDKMTGLEAIKLHPGHSTTESLTSKEADISENTKTGTQETLNNQRPESHQLHSEEFKSIHEKNSKSLTNSTPLSETRNSSDSKPGLFQRRKNGTVFQRPLRFPAGTVLQQGQNIKKDRNNTTGITGQTSMLANETQSRVSGNSEDKPLNYVGLENITSTGVVLIWGAPQGMFNSFVVTRHLAGFSSEPHNEEEKEKISNGTQKSEVDRVEEDSQRPVPGIKMNLLQEGVNGKFNKVLPGSARSFWFKGLLPQMQYSLSVFGKGPGLRSKIHSVIVNTGPEPPSNLLFSDITDTTASVSWTRPRSPVTGFKVTYSHTVEGEPVSIVVDSKNSRINLSKLTPGSSYDVTVISLKDLDESDAITDVAHTLPDPPTDLRAINVTDTKALLLWRPALAAIDHYVIVYRSGKEPDMTITVSGNAAEQQLTKLHGSTEYMVTVTSQLGSRMSSGSKTIFTTTSGFIGGEGPRELTARQVTPRSAMLSWKPPPLPVSSYKLTYQAEGHEIKEVNPDPTTSEYRLTRLRPGSKYTVRLQAERGGLYIESISTEFITGNLRFPFPTDCSQELLNGMQISGEAEIFPLGQNAAPVMVYCDMETDGGGWTVFQRRLDGKVNFFKLWKEYRDGFGDVNKEFWLGNELIHNLTRLIPMSLRVDLRAGSESVYAKYSSFSIGPQKLYTLRVSGYSGTSGDSLTYHNGRAFSTRDRDRSDIRFCAMSYRGGWWYRNCHEANLNGLYDTPSSHQGVIWTAWKGKDFSIPFTEMKMRPASFRPPAQG
ncbi:tenascin-like isoform X2 [Denticeps clupeoides]|uniref:tenascin-like isoform X2 n=1 Tax=Denticeps clupeoides TaxID=299321 RepID=UPI0010A426A4|nr:tenascin-like isoform X2 [Denticeps clupeoides]